MQQSAYPLVEFQAALNGRISPNSIHQTALAIRRVLKAIGPDDLTDPQMLAYYRASLPEKTRNVFGCAWNKFVEWMATNDVTLPETINMPKTRFVHPLWSDVTDLTIHWTPESIERMHWSDDRVVRGPDEVVTAAWRAFTFLAGRKPTPEDWLLPRRIDSSDPLPAWAIETILRSDARATPGIVERFWAFVVETSTRRGVTAHELRQVYAGLWDNRRKLDRDPDSIKVVRREIEEDGALPWTVSQRRVADLIGGEFPSVDGLVFW